MKGVLWREISFLLIPSTKYISMSSDDHLKVKCSSQWIFPPFFQSLSAQKLCLASAVLLLFQFGMLLVDVASENHDRGTFVNSWHKRASRSPIWWFYIEHRWLQRHISHDVCYSGLLCPYSSQTVFPFGSVVCFTALRSNTLFSSRLL